MMAAWDLIVRRVDTDLPPVSEEQALNMPSGTLVWLKWDSPGLDGHNEWWSATVRKPLYGKAGDAAKLDEQPKPRRKQTNWKTGKKTKGSKLVRPIASTPNTTAQCCGRLTIPPCCVWIYRRVRG